MKKMADYYRPAYSCGPRISFNACSHERFGSALAALNKLDDRGQPVDPKRLTGGQEPSAEVRQAEH
jgi:hypothetical protein